MLSVYCICIHLAATIHYTVQAATNIQYTELTYSTLNKLLLTYSQGSIQWGGGRGEASPIIRK